MIPVSQAGPINRIVVTGAAGRLGSALAQRLAGQVPIPLIATDRAPNPGLGIDYLQAELSDTRAVADALRPGDLLVHVAAIHGLSAAYSDMSDDLYFDLNCKGTWNLYAAAAKAGVRKAILTSTIGSLGADPDPSPFKPYSGFENFPASMGIYALSKRVQEEIAATFAHYSAMSTVVLRPPAFVALNPVETGLMLTKDYLTIDDILDAHVAAVDAVLTRRIIDSPDGVIEQIFVANVLPYQPGDSELIAADGNLFPVVKKYWPSAADWLAEHGYLTRTETPFLLFSPTRLPMMASPERARTLLGWTPKTTFDAWFAANVG
jgi:nucleoside-diphosphate-sugar epimerase